MYRYGKAVRMKCKYSHEAAEMFRKMLLQQAGAAEGDKDNEIGREEKPAAKDGASKDS
ncbi:hypothetical protein COL922a_014732, partial [Colletotrichum nupharicola]